ncbi:MAG: 4-(cytidine 5'-diphospho)-2-C-methyl-D-erythritol kinase [Lachnospiraceae bacterium]|nr:4-(cytidine 5'-diphospho)-2-C-methyl-D-erythritol kinase [Lachnospiraceae bacterium]
MKLTLQAHAKINLALDVLSRRSDGYHELRMIMESLTLCDTVTLSDELSSSEAADGISPVSLTSSDPSLPAGPSNLAVKAALLLAQKTAHTLPLSIHIEKRIPAAAGLAGGSADAAAVLTGANELYSLGLSQKELMAIGKELGADIPYCILRGSSVAEGIGEVLTPAPSLAGIPVVLAKPAEGLSTKEIFQALILDQNTPHPDTAEMLKAMDKHNLSDLGRLRANLLESVAIPRLPLIKTLIDHLKEAGSPCAGMTGSGPTVFALFEDPALAGSVYHSLISAFPEVRFYLTEIL